MSLHSVTALLNVESVTRSIEFYRTGFGFRVVQEWQDAGRIRWASLESNGVRIMLNEPPRADSAERRQRDTYADAVLYFYVADADALREKLKTQGVSVSVIADANYGMREFYVRDPDGYELGFGASIASDQESISSRESRSL